MGAANDVGVLDAPGNVAVMMVDSAPEDAADNAGSTGPVTGRAIGRATGRATGPAEGSTTAGGSVAS